MQHWHPNGLRCPHCQAKHAQARFFRVNAGSGLAVYRCQHCQGIYHLYSGTVFEYSQLTPSQVILLLRGVLQGQASAHLAREIGLTEKVILKWRHRLQAHRWDFRHLPALRHRIISAQPFTAMLAVLRFVDLKLAHLFRRYWLAIVSFAPGLPFFSR